MLLLSLTLAGERGKRKKKSEGGGKKEELGEFIDQVSVPNEIR